MLSNLGRPDEPTALIHNPAGLADQAGTQVYFFLSPTFLSLDMDMQALDPQRFPEINPAGCGTQGQPACPWPIDDAGYYTRKIRPERYFGVLPYVGASTDLGFIDRRARDVVVALSVHAPNFYGAYFPAEAPSAYNFIGGMFLMTGATVGAGWRINRFVSIGASLSYHYMYISMSQKLSVVDLVRPQLAQLAQLAIGDIRLDYEGTDHGVGWGAGMLLTPLPWLNIGLGYSGASSPHFVGDVHLTSLSKYATDEEALRDLARDLGYKLPRQLTVQMTIPPALAAGVNVAIGPRVEIGVDIRFWLYNLYKRQVITPGYDPDDKGEEPITEEGLSRDKDYHLSYQLTVGAMVRPWRSMQQLELMAGVGYDQSPIPDETLSLDNPSLSQAKLTTGLRWQIDARWRVSATYMLVIYLPVDVRNSRTHPPTNVRGAGLSHSPAVAVTCRF